MNKTTLFMVLVLASGSLAAADPVPADKDSVRTIVLKQDDAQTRFESKIYELHHVKSTEILPFVNSAILRYSKASTIRRIAPQNGSRDAILVSTGRDFLPYVDEIVKALDRPGKEGSEAVQGTGVSRIAYTPRYRAASQFADIIDTTISTSDGKAYVNAETNTIFWRDQESAAKETLGWVEKLDRPIPQTSIRLNYYEIRDSDLKDWGFDYLAWKNGPGVNLLNLGYNAGHFAVDQLLETAQYAAAASWGYGGFFTAPQFDMSFIRCLQQSGNASVAANASLTVINTPVRSKEEYRELTRYQIQNMWKAPFIYRVSMFPEYQNISKNVLGRTLVGKSYYEDEDGNKFSDPPVLEARIINPFICLSHEDTDADSRGFLPDTPEFMNGRSKLSKNGGVLFNYSLNFKNVVERGNTGAELSNSIICSGATTLGFGVEKILAVYEKENDVEQTIGLPILCRIPYIKYLFSTVTSIKERTYIVVSAEAALVHPESETAPVRSSISTGVRRRIENPFREVPEEEETQTEAKKE